MSTILMFDSSVKRKSHFLYMLIMTQYTVVNKDTGFGVSHLGSSANYVFELQLSYVLVVILDRIIVRIK